jgi:hypothetical protein
LAPGSQLLGSLTPDLRLPTGLNEFLHPSLTDVASRVRVSVVGVTALDADKDGRNSGSSGLTCPHRRLVFCGGGLEQRRTVLWALVPQMLGGLAPAFIEDGVLKASLSG